MNGGEPRLRGCIGTLEARCLINGFKDYALTRYSCIIYSRHLLTYSMSCCGFLNLSPSHQVLNWLLQLSLCPSNNERRALCDDKFMKFVLFIKE